MKKLISIVLAIIMLLTISVVAFAAENKTHEIAEKETGVHEQIEKNVSAAQKVTEEVKETTEKVKEETKEKKQPGFEFVFAAAGLMTVFYMLSRKKS